MRHGDKLERAQKLAVGRIMEAVDRVTDSDDLSPHGRHIIRLVVFKELGVFENKVRDGVRCGDLLNAVDDNQWDSKVPNQPGC
jgi:hypothetical protein